MKFWFDFNFCFRIFSARWKPVATDMDVDEEASEKPIIKNGNMIIDYWLFFIDYWF